ncbi:glycosyltransferase family 4 protein [Rheinheimera sp.]|uniref:glycosyltransferase family 4 protein n=1 Tax=Rheinheimera sp. TaxID=1869214 RepID=UPI002735D1D6|nr:glycosyltransferase family 4 protein [Rheinheimera sp.]MDP2715682.1 glycosyltransferase family 4 protein [Rheinheimera sp.]
MKKKLLFVVNVDWFFLSHRLPIALAAQAAGYEVNIACQLTAKGEAIKGYGFILHNLPLERSGTSVFKEFKTLVAIKRVIKLSRPDIIHAVTIKPVLYTGLATLFSKIPKVSSISGLGFVFISEGLKARLVRVFISFLYRLALRHRKSRVIFQNPTDRDLFISAGIISANQAIMIRGSGVNFAEYPFSEEPQGKPVAMLLARLLTDKGVLEFVEAAKLLRASNISCRLVLVGDVDENPKSVSQAQLNSWVGQQLIEYWGFSSDVAASYRQANIVVLPSYREGLPKSLIEAAACGRAVITTDVPGCRDAITPDVTGLLVPVKDSAALAGAIEKLVNDSDLRLSFGVAGRRLAEREFDINSVVNKHFAIYEELLKGNVVEQ